MPEPSKDNAPKMCTIQPLTGMRLTGASVGLGTLGAAILLSGFINLATFGWRIAFAILAACGCFGLAVLNFRATLRLAQLRVEKADKTPTQVPMKTAWNWLLANVAVFALVMVLCWLAVPAK